MNSYDKSFLFQDKKWFEDAVAKVIKDNIGDSYASSLAAECYFVDFLRDAEEVTAESVGDISDETDFDMPHVYETISSWDSLRDRLTYFMNQYNEQVNRLYLYVSL